MKILKFLTIIAMAIFLFTTCEKDRTKYEYEGKDFMHFSERVYKTIENATDVLPVIIKLTSPATTPITVDFAFTNSDITKAIAKPDVDYKFLTGGTSVTFAVGESEKALEFKTINNIEAGDTTFKEICIELTGNSAGITIGFPGSDALNSTTKIFIQDDDCPLLMSDWVGSFKGRELSPYWDQTDTYKFVADSVYGPKKISLTVTGIFQPQLQTAPDDAWGEVWVTGGTVTLILDITDAANPKAIIEPQYFGQTVDPTGANWDYWIFQNSGPGTFSTCDGTLSIPYSISWDDAYTPSSWCNFTVTFKLK